MKLTILFDLDGTLADIKHRRIFLENTPPDWQSFNLAMGDDIPNKPIIDLYKTLWESAKYDIILISGRNEKHRKITEQWLSCNEVPFSRLMLRADKDSRSDHIIKEEILIQLQNEGKKVLFVVDDRQQVVDMWRRNGLVCLQCDVGNF